MSAPYTCPVCRGTKSVPGGFYGLPMQSLNDVALREPCRSCDATGIVWSPDDEPPAAQPARVQPKPFSPETGASNIIVYDNGATLTLVSAGGSLTATQGRIAAGDRRCSIDPLWRNA